MARSTKLHRDGPCGVREYRSREYRSRFTVRWWKYFHGPAKTKQLNNRQIRHTQNLEVRLHGEIDTPRKRNWLWDW
jgi:hypothetical protein